MNRVRAAAARNTRSAAAHECLRLPEIANHSGSPRVIPLCKTFGMRGGSCVRAPASQRRLCFLWHSGSGRTRPFFSWWMRIHYRALSSELSLDKTREVLAVLDRAEILEVLERNPIEKI